MDRPAKRRIRRTQSKDTQMYDKGYNHCIEDWEAYLKSATNKGHNQTFKSLKLDKPYS